MDMVITLLVYTVSVLAVSIWLSGWYAHSVYLRWKRTGESIPPERLDTYVTGLDWSEVLPSPQQVAFEQMLRWQSLRQQWDGVDLENH